MAQNSETAHSFQLGEFLDSQRQAATMTDVVLVCGGRDFPAHKMILSATSNYFRAMFSPGWDESKSSRIELPYVGAEEMDIILPFLYTGKFKDVEDQPFLKALLAASHSLEVNALFEFYYKKLSEKLRCNSFLKITNLAFHYNDEGMTRHVLTFLTHHFEDVAKSEEFLKLSACQMQKICQNPDAIKFSLDVVISGLFRWTEVDQDRENTLLQILINLDLQGMSTAFLLENLRERPLVKKNYHVLTLMTAEATSRTLALSLNNFQNPNEPKFLTVGKHPEQQVFSISIYNIKQTQWSVPKILPFHVEVGMSMVWFGGHLYFLGGGEDDDIRPLAKVIKYCPGTNTIASFGSLVEPVCCAGTGVLYEHIYIVNGLNEKNQPVTTVQRFNPVTGTCEMRAQTNRPHFRSLVLPFAKYLLVLGSINDNSIERYDPECDTWTLITSIPGKTAKCRAAVCNEKLFVLPVADTSVFQIYDLPFGTWEQKQFEGSPGKIQFLYTTTINGKVILLVIDNERILHSFDPASGQWLKKPNSYDGLRNFWLTCVV